jgi:Zn-dependent alcohol dehydrogenases, class III
MDIKAAVVREKGGKMIIEDVQLDEPQENEVLVRIVGCGLCQTDLACRDQYYPVPIPVVLGHEGSGVVEKVGAKVTKVVPGDHVAMSYLSCRKCPTCQEGHIGYCPDYYTANFSGGRLTDGTITLKKGDEDIHGCFFSQSSFATHALATENNIVKVDKDLPLEALGPLGCGVQTGAGTVMNTLKPGPGSSIAVFGCGTVGISAIMAALVCGCTTIIAVDINDERLEVVKEYGATHTVNSKKVNPVEAIREITGGFGVNYSVEALGRPEVLRQAVDSLRLTGTCGLIGAAPMGTESSLDMNNFMFGRCLVGVIEGDSIPDVFIPKLLALYRQGRFPFDKMITYYDFKDINQAVEDLEKGRVIKGILRMS